MSTCITRTCHHPTQRFEEVIPANFDIRRNTIDERGLSPTKHDVFPCCLQLVVHYLKWPRTVPTRDSLRILALDVNVGNIRVNYRQKRPVERNPALHVPFRRSMNVAPVNDDVMR